MISGLSTNTDTIFAAATAPGRAAIAVVRISGSQTPHVLRQMAGRLTPPRQAALRKIRRPDGSLLDECLVIRFPHGGSYTGEAAAELHVHGGRATMSAVLETLAGFPGMRPARPGEFTLRALLAGRMDLAQVEGLADLVDAETEAQRRQAQRQFGGAVGQQAARWKRQLTRSLALLETELEFSEEDIPLDLSQRASAELYALRDELKVELRGVATAERLREGFEVAIVGRPNIGKSTLLNCLAGREAAITSSIAGTTRDVVEVRMDLHGLPVTLLDTAGLRDSADPIETIGVERTVARARNSDLRVFLTGSSPAGGGRLEPASGDIVLHGKCDLGNPGPHAGVSGKTGEGVDAMIERIVNVLENRLARVATMTNIRHRKALETAVEALEAAEGTLASATFGAEICSEEIRNAVKSLDSLTGTVDIEHVLDEIFASFCIGK